MKLRNVTGYFVRCVSRWPATSVSRVMVITEVSGQIFVRVAKYSPNSFNLSLNYVK